MHRQLLICDKWNAGNAGRVGDITAWGYPLITGWPRINYNPTKTQARRRNVALLRRPYPAGRGTAPIRGTRRDRAFPAYLESIVSNVSSISRPLSLSRRVSTRPRYVLRIARGSALEARYVTRKKCTKEETRASVPRCLTPTLNSILFKKRVGGGGGEVAFLGFECNEKSRCRGETFPRVLPGQNGYRRGSTRGSITTFYCISISFPGGQRNGRGGKRESWRSREGWKLRAARLFGERKRRGRGMSRLSFSEKKRCLK